MIPYIGNYAYGNIDTPFAITLIIITIVTTIAWCIIAYRKGWF